MSKAKRIIVGSSCGRVGHCAKVPPGRELRSPHGPILSLHPRVEGGRVDSTRRPAGPCSNLERDPRVTVVVYAPSNPYEYVEIRGTAIGATDGADEHIDRLAKKYLGQDTYPYRQPGEQRVRFVITPDRVRHMKQ